LRQTYLMGRLDGMAEYLQDGVVVRRESYRLGLLDGETRDYAADGTLLAASPYRAGVLHGIARRYAPDGAALAERRYVNGAPEQPWRRLEPADSEPSSPTFGARLEKWIRG
jgi:antitoxin component YwqK of YwqJK toxin-antitoxin module